MSARRTWRSLTTGVILAGAVPCLLNCSDSNTGSGPSAPDIQDLILGITDSSGTVTAVHHTGTPPAVPSITSRTRNITYAAPPSGNYKVRVDYYDACGVPATNYVVTVRRKGHRGWTSPPSPIRNGASLVCGPLATFTVKVAGGGARAGT